MKRWRESTHITLLHSVSGVADEVRPVCGPDPLVLSGLVLLLVSQLKWEKMDTQNGYRLKWDSSSYLRYMR